MVLYKRYLYTLEVKQQLEREFKMFRNKYNSLLGSSHSVNSVDTISPMNGREDDFEFTDVNGYALPPDILPEVYKQYIVAKYQLALPLLRKDWRKVLPTAPNFISLVEKNNVAFNVSVKELNRILLSGYFTMDEQQVIKKMRYQGRNNQAAKVMREKYKQKEHFDSSDMDKLQKEKLDLIAEKEQLEAEIKYYQKMTAKEECNVNTKQ